MSRFISYNGQLYAVARYPLNVVQRFFSRWTMATDYAAIVDGQLRRLYQHGDIHWIE